MKQLLTKIALFILLFAGGAIHAQTAFWTETFNTGIPSGWTNVDASNQGIIWEWCANTAPGCAPRF
jgi:hypothetical protein